MTKAGSKKMSATLAPAYRQLLEAQVKKGVYTPYKVSRITCVINQQHSERVTDYLKALEVDAYIENGRSMREYIKPKGFGFPGNTVKLESTNVSVFRFTVPLENSWKVMESIAAIFELNIPGRGTIFSQELLEFSKEPPFVNTEELEQRHRSVAEIHFLPDLAYVVCVLSAHGAGEQLSRLALDLGICVPLLTFGTGSDIRDQLGLIRITISPEKEIVHLVMPQQDSNSIIRLLVEESKLDRPGRGYIYETPVSIGLVDTRMKIGKQNYAASVDQIIAAIDTLKMGTNWRKRLDTETQKTISQSFLPKANCEISIVSEEDRINELREACIKLGATGAVTSRLTVVRPERNAGAPMNLIRSEISAPVEIAVKVVEAILGTTSAMENSVDRIQFLSGDRDLLPQS